MELSIIVPCYNEADNLADVMVAFRQVIGGRHDIELLLVDNGSTDGTARVLGDLLREPRNAFAREVRVVSNKGYGFGILSGLRSASGEFLAWTHADLQADPADVIRAFDVIRAVDDPRRTLVRGRRIGRPVFDRVFTAGMGLMASVLLGSRLHDINAQPKVFHRELLEAMDDAPYDFSLDLYLLHLANRKQLDVREIPVRFGARQRGEAKGGGSLAGKVRLTRRTMDYMLTLRRSLRAGLDCKPREGSTP